MKKGIIAGVIICIAAGGAYYHFYYKANQSASTNSQRVSSDSEDAVYVTSVADIAGLGSGSGVIQRFAGVVVSQETWTAKLENDKTVKETYVSEGDEVKKGDVLFTYDTSEDEDKLEQDEIDIERAKNDIETSNAQITQLEKEAASASEDDKLTYTTQILSEQNSIKQNEYDIKSKEVEIESLKQSIADADVTSKIDGVVKSVASSSSSSDSSSDAYITVMQVGDYRVQGTLNEQNFNEISEGDEVICYSRVDSTQYWTGTVTKIRTNSGSSNSSDDEYSDSSSDSSTSSTNYPFYVALDSSEGLLLGQHLYLEKNEGQLEEKDGIWIPDYYIDSEDGTSFVWAASDKNVLEKRTITLGEYDEDMMEYEILDGLTADDYIAAPDTSLAEGAPLIYNDSSDANEDMYDVYDSLGDGSWDDGSWDDEYWDDGSYDWEEDLGDDVSYYDADEWDFSEDGDDDDWTDDGNDDDWTDDGDDDDWDDE